jgi:hypothetical protein
MADDSGSKDRSLEALDFIINVLKEHEQNLDESIGNLADVVEKIGITETLNGKIERVEEKIDNLQKEVANLVGLLSSAPETDLAATVRKPESQAPTATVSSIAPGKSGLAVILHCKQWVDFQALAMQAQTLSFCYKDAVFQADALKGNQLIKYSGALPNFSLILKTWLSEQLNITQQNIFEGLLDKPE